MVRKTKNNWFSLGDQARSFFAKNFFIIHSSLFVRDPSRTYDYFSIMLFQSTLWLNFNGFDSAALLR